MRMELLVSKCIPTTRKMVDIEFNFFLSDKSLQFHQLKTSWEKKYNEITRFVETYYYEKFKDFRVAILDFCNKSSPEFKQLLRKSVGHKLHLLAA